ncbi:MAG TPA: BON domain-containing protein [Chthonomonadaceae bacterium]|nr:BON domain-containing protein [Chthonomonadaceae bacterium]
MNRKLVVDTDRGDFVKGPEGPPPEQRGWPGGLPPTDQDIADYITNALSNDSHLARETDIHVQVHGGHVTLTGVVHSERAKTAAGNYAWTAPAIRDVSNKIQVKDR